MYHRIMYDRQVPVGSYWEASAGGPVAGCDSLEGDVTADVAIIGAGYTGLSAAYHLASVDQLDVRVLEAGAPGWGASGRNGGHCCFGGAGLEPHEIKKRFGEQVAKANIATQRESIELVDELATTHGFEIDKHGSGELCFAHKPAAMTHLRDEAAMWKALGGFDCELMSAQAFKERGFDGPNIHGGMLFPFGFGLHPMKYARSLAGLALSAGAVVHSQSEVKSWSREQGVHRLHTDRGSVRARKVLIATNGFTLDDLHPALSGTLLPGISQVVATRELTEDELAAHNWQTEHPLYDTRALFSYLQLTPHRRLVLGGGGGMSGSPRSSRFWERVLRRRIATVFPEWNNVEVTHSWRGFFCLTRDRLTHIGEMDNDPGVFYSLAYHGNGVAMATWSGRAVAGMISGRSNARIPDSMRQPLQRFAVPALRKSDVYWRYGKRLVADFFQ